MTPHFHSLYGLNLASDFDLGLPPARGKTDLWIYRGEGRGARLQLTTGRAWLDPQAGTIHFQPGPRLDAEAIRQVILNVLLLEMLPRLGYVCLHGSAATRDGCTLAVLAPQGTGKSTYAAALASQGWRLLSDDLLIIEAEKLTIQPGIPQIRLWRDSIETLGWQRRPRDPDRYRPGKFALPLQTDPHPRRPDAMIVLARGQGEIRRLAPAEAFFSLLNNSFPLQIPDRRAEALRFQTLSRLSRDLPVYRQSLTPRILENARRALDAVVPASAKTTP
ncbi:hypothetical protein MIN45_P0129 [Methylomarinovum tepidoasis]|uniref:Hpr(Ser) kinase/phosphatase n=1 Tax=Methylomarinovum tepidoasis TaxID=2840183 RepID=A0AAU9C307_9GAMM|nr:hypothetical protein [Methylomarinovum sp. IN45]BCX87762.1 hypothetical protein MIN45_P0129 [Methylomarinovum sp. IN45]